MMLNGTGTATATSPKPGSRSTTRSVRCAAAGHPPRAARRTSATRHTPSIRLPRYRGVPWRPAGALCIAVFGNCVPASCTPEQALTLGFGRIVASEIEVPNMLVNMSDSAKRQCGRAIPSPGRPTRSPGQLARHGGPGLRRAQLAQVPGLPTQRVLGAPQDSLAPHRGPLGPSPDRESAIGNAPALVPGPVAGL
jgi:hypothetical protein